LCGFEVLYPLRSRLIAVHASHAPLFCMRSELFKGCGDFESSHRCRERPRHDLDLSLGNTVSARAASVGVVPGREPICSVRH